MDVDVYFKNPNLTSDSFRKAILSAQYSSLLTINDIVGTTGKKLAKYDLALLVRHPLVVTDQTEKYSLDMCLNHYPSVSYTPKFVY